MALGASYGYLPLVTLSGRVGSDTPIVGEQSGLEAVTQIFLKKQEEDVKEYMVVKKTKDEDGTEMIMVRKKENDNERWVQCSEQISSKRKEVPWYLDDGTGRLEVVRAHNADGSILRLESVDFEKQPRTCGCECSIKILGLRRTEWTLPTGTNLTVVGEAVKGNSGEILIKRPRNGGPFHVSRSSIDKIVSNLGSDARWCQFWAVTFATSGAFLLGIGGYAMC
ncbi:E3 ubiquitin-protein ligase SP1 [Setaria italica]|uniref:E3 ubiquitin-protein ligase SP1 n=1 Tax=Setaria italica TaxID=4555 RepID=UPI000648BC2B|nr:E3 ubiquitin-protein ligase SP1 [Setaria italica]